MSWIVERSVGSAGRFHDRPMPDPLERALWIFEPAAPAVVLGSAQRESVIDREAAERLGIELVRRRSGGGAVLLVPGEVLWVDVVLPRGDPRWHDDVGRAFHWLGEAWAEALVSVGVAASDLAVHRGPMVRTAWSDLVCFAGLGAGEVTVDGRKAVGISQRRTRDAARFQCVVHRRWDGERLRAVLTEPRPSSSELAAMAAEVDDLDRVAEVLVTVLASR